MVSLVGTSLGIIRSSSGVFRASSFDWSWCKAATQQQLLCSKETLPFLSGQQRLLRHLIRLVSMLMFSLIAHHKLAIFDVCVSQ